MARYLIFSSHYDGLLIEASADVPNVVTKDDDYVPSARWRPLDKAAQEALHRVDVANFQKELDNADDLLRKRLEKDRATRTALRPIIGEPEDAASSTPDPIALRDLAKVGPLGGSPPAKGGRRSDQDILR